MATASASVFDRPSSRPGTPRSRPELIRSSTLRPSSSTSSLSSLFGGVANSTSGARSDHDPKSLICRAFVPHIAVHVSEDTDELAREKGFASFKEMLRPYGDDLHGRITVRDSMGASNSYEDFSVRFVGLGEVAASGERWETGMSAWANGRGGATAGAGGGGGGGPVQSEKAEKVFVGGNLDEVEDLMNLQLDLSEGGAELSDEGTPNDRGFYLHYLRKTLSALPVSPHETFSHPIACVIAISSRNKAPIETLRNLYASGNQVPLPKYVYLDYLRYYVLVHDEDRDDITKSTALFEQMKKHFGLSCHLLHLRSGGKTAATDDDAVIFPTSQWRPAGEELAEIRAKDTEDREPLYLSETDASGIATMIREMTQMSVIPFMERCIATWNDQIASRRRGISGRFLTMSKRYFPGTSSSSRSSSSNYDPVSASYPPNAPEAMMRKLADFAFMLRDWKLAHSIYDLLRTDFNNDKAWKYHAGSNEMTAISLILTPTALSHKLRQETIEPMIDLACYSYNSRCSAPFSALRCLLVSVELLRLRSGGAVDEAAKWAVRALDTQGIGTISHALITERVGDCYAVRQGRGVTHLGGRRRKAAMWKVLAAREWVEMGKLGRARLCLDDALPMFRESQFTGVRKVLDGLVEKAGYVVEEQEEEEEEEERLELGTKGNRRSVILTEEEKGGRGDDDFVDS